MKEDEWFYNNNLTVAIKNIDNQKDTKYMEEILEKYSETDSTGAKNIDTHAAYEKVQSTTIKTKYLKELERIAKASQADKIDLYISEDKPLKAKLIDDNRKGSKEVGTVVIAQLKNAEDRRRLEKTKQEL